VFEGGEFPCRVAGKTVVIQITTGNNVTGYVRRTYPVERKNVKMLSNPDKEAKEQLKKLMRHINFFNCSLASLSGLDNIFTFFLSTGYILVCVSPVTLFIVST
jgi:hypothetical protein